MIYGKDLPLLEQIKEFRSRNKELWMELSLLSDKVAVIAGALDANRDYAVKLLTQIADNDEKILERTRKLCSLSQVEPLAGDTRRTS